MSCPVLPIRPPHILLPDTNVDLYKWAVVACDQFTAEPEYWSEVDKICGDAPSTLRITYPEVYLNESEEAKKSRLETIQSTMKEYRDKKIFQERTDYIYVVRTAKGRTRHGVMVELDLEQYEFTPQAQTLIRPTEGTILERLPPRMRIRENAIIEIPHILILINDPERKAIEPLEAFRKDMPKLYETDLMQDGGHVCGYALPKAAAEAFENQLRALGCPDHQKKMYGDIKAPFVYAVGDGNHSLATAKSLWEQLKAKGADPATNPARFAMVEINNIHDDGLVFEPIHRALFHCPEDPIAALEKFFSGKAKFEPMSAKDAIAQVNKAGNTAPHHIAYVSPKVEGLITIADPTATLVVATLQPFLDQFVEKKDIDYIHNEEPTIKLGKVAGQCSFLLPAMAKDDLFKGVVASGVVPRKTFSMGEAEEKRYYMECRYIVDK